MNKELTQAALLLLTKPVEKVVVFDRNFQPRVVADKIDDIKRAYAHYVYEGLYDVDVVTACGDKERFPVKVNEGVIWDSNPITGRLTVEFPLGNFHAGDEKIRFELRVR